MQMGYERDVFNAKKAANLVFLSSSKFLWFFIVTYSQTSSDSEKKNGGKKITIVLSLINLGNLC